MLKENTTRFQVFPGIYIYIYIKSTCMKTCLSIHVVCHPIHKAKQHVQVAAMRAGGHRKGMELASAPGSTFSYSFPLKILFFLLVGKQQQKFDMFFPVNYCGIFISLERCFFCNISGSSICFLFLMLPGCSMWAFHACLTGPVMVGHHYSSVT